MPVRLLKFNIFYQESLFCAVCTFWSSSLQNVQGPSRFLYYFPVRRSNRFAAKRGVALILYPAFRGRGTAGARTFLPLPPPYPRCSRQSRLCTTKALPTSVRRWQTAKAPSSSTRSRLAGISQGLQSLNLKSQPSSVSEVL